MSSRFWRTLGICIFIGLVLLPLRLESSQKDKSEGPKAKSVDPKEKEAERVKTAWEAYEATSELVDKLFLGGKVGEMSKTVTDPATYREYTELAYSMNPVDFFYYATPTYKKELLFDSFMTVSRKVATIAGPVVGFEVIVGLDTLDHMVNLEQGKEPFKLTKDLKVRFLDAFHEHIIGKDTIGKVFDFVFVENSANDAIKEIKRLQQAFLSAASQLESLARDLRAQEDAKKLGLQKQMEGAQGEIKRLQGLATPDATPDRKNELDALVQAQQRNLAILGRQVDHTGIRLAMAERMRNQAAHHRESAARLERVAGGIKGNLPLLGKLADYLKENRQGIPVTDVQDMIDVFEEVAARKKDWKGELEDLRDLYAREGFSGLFDKALDAGFSEGEAAYKEILAWKDTIGKLKTHFDRIEQLLIPADTVVKAGAGAHGTYLAVMYWGDNNVERLKKTGENAWRLVSGKGDTKEYQDIRDAAKFAVKLLEKSEELAKKIEGVKKQIDSLQEAALFPSWTEIFGISKEKEKELNDLLESYEKQKKEIMESFEKNTSLGKAKKWIEEKQKKVEEFKENWKDVIETVVAVIKLLDKDMPELDLAPDQEYKDMLLGWYGGEGTTFTGFAVAKDKTSGLNPAEVHLFYYDTQKKINYPITDVRFIPEKKTEFQVRETRIQQARIRYRFTLPGPGDYEVWGYVRDRAGHASCALANARHSLQTDHAKWDYAKEKPEERRFLEFVQTMMKELGLNPDEIFRKRDFHEVRLKLKLDETPARIVIHEPYNRSEQGLEASRPLRFNFEIEDPESWINPEDLAVWITDEFGLPIWEAKKADDWQITLPTNLSDAEKFRVEKTKMIPKATIEVPGAKHQGPGIYYACVQAMNGAQVVSGTRTMFFVGDVKPWVLISDVRPFRAFYQQNDEIKIQHTFWNIHDTAIRSVKLALKQTPGILKVVTADPAESQPIPSGARQRIAGDHTFKVAGKPQEQKVSLVYECTIDYENPQPARTVAIPVPINLHDEDALKVNYLKGSLHFKYQDETHPVPFGTALCVSQVYQMPALGTPKWVEQYIGYGEVANDSGDFDLRISPVGKPPFRLRLVAKSYAREKNQLKGGFTGTAGVFGLETSRPLVCITPTFDVSVSAENVFKNNIYDVGTQVIPYYSAYLKAKSRRIGIQWEGELSTGGYISPYGHDFAQNPFRAYGNFLTSINPAEITQSLVGHGQETGIEDVKPGINAMESGIWYLNFNGSLSILETLVKSHRFTKQLRYLAKDGTPYLSAPIPLAFSQGKPLAGRPQKIITTKNGTKLDITDKIAKALQNDFPFRAELIRERHIKEDFFEEHDFVYQAKEPPPGRDYLELTKKVEETRYTTKKIPVRVYVVADTKNDRVVLLEPTTNTTTTVVSKVADPVSVQKLSEISYLVCSRAGNEVAIYQNSTPVWTFPPREGMPAIQPSKPGEATTLNRPEFAASTEAGTLIICDAGNHRVLEVDPRGRRVLWVYDKLVDPVMATLTPRGTILIADRGAHTVEEVSPEGTVVWSFGSAGKPGSENLLKQPLSALRSAGITTIVDAGNQRVLHVADDGTVKRTIKTISEMRTNPDTGKPETITIALDKLAFATRYSGIDFLINGDTIYGVDPENKVTGKAGGEKSLASPEHFGFSSLRVTIKVPEKVIRDEPFYVWKKSVQIVKKPKTRVYLDEEKSAIELDPRYKEEMPAVGTTANWAPGHLLARKHGLATAGIALNQDRLRIYVNGGNDNADDNDPHVIARAFGNLLRNRLIRKSLDSHDYDVRMRATPRQAWERGWDTFLACAIVENGKFVDRNFLGQEITNLTFDFDKTYGEMLARFQKEPSTLERDFGKFRGLDSQAALAMLFHRIYKTQGSIVISHALTFARGGSRADGTVVPTGRYLDPATLLALYPDMRQTMEVLGLIPKLTLRFPDKGIDTLNTAYPKLEWDANGLLDDPDNINFTLIISEDRPENVISRIPAIQGQSLDFGQILRPEDAALKLAMQFEGRKIYYWRVEVAIEDGPMEYRCSSPWGAFEIEMKTQVITQEGGTVDLEATNSPMRLYGRLVFPPAVIKDQAKVSVSPLKLGRDQGEFEAIHGTAFDVRMVGVGSGEWRVERKDLSPPHPSLEFQIMDKDLAGRDPRGLGIYRFNQEGKNWDYVGGILDKGTIRCPANRGGLYAVMFDKVGVAFTRIADSPDPATSDDTLTIQFGLRKPTVVSLLVKDGAGKLIVAPMDKKLLEGARHEVKLPLRDWSEGRYSYTLLGTDPVNPEGKAVQETRSFTISNVPGGTIQGAIVVPAGSPELPWRASIPDTSIEFQGNASEREFTLHGVAPGPQEVHIERPGLFPEICRVNLAAGATVSLAPINLTNEVLTRAKTAYEVFTPNNDGERDYCVLELQAKRACNVQVRVLDTAGRKVATLAGSKEKTGAGRTELLPGQSAFLFWRGNDDRGRTLPSGWYNLEVVADALGTWVPAAKVPVLLDRGLVREALPLPGIFSPNGDGFEDEIQFTYLLDGEAKVTLEIHDAKWRLLATPLKDAKQSAGPQAITWNGKREDGTTLPDGRYHFVILPRYLTGQASLPVRGTFLVDSSPPEIVDLQPLNGQKLNDSRPTIQAKVRVDIDDLDKDGLRFKIDEYSVLPDAFDPRTGVYTFRPRTALGEGLHIVIAYARDLAGNEAPPKAVSFTIERGTKEKKYIDRDAPKVTLLTPAEKAIVYTGTPLVSALLFDDGSGIDEKNIVVHLDGERICNNVKMYLPGASGKSWDWYYFEKAIILYDPLLGEMRFVPGTPLAAGNHHVRVEVLDRQGNKGKAECIFKVEIDKEPPVISDIFPAPGGLEIKEVTHIRAKIADQGPSGVDAGTLRLVIDGEVMPGNLPAMYDPAKQIFTYSLDKPLLPGSQHAIILSVRDRAGNPAEAKVNVLTLVKDKTPPRIDVFSPSPGQELPAKNVRLTATLYDLGPAGLDEGSLSVKLDGIALQATQAAKQGRAIDLDGMLPQLEPGPHLLTLFIRDRAGNGSREAVVPFTVLKGVSHEK